MYVNNQTSGDQAATARHDHIAWGRIAPWLGMQAGCLLVFVVGWSPVAVGVAVALYIIRMFAVTAFYHRYFSHRAYVLSRPVQLMAAVLGASGSRAGLRPFLRGS